MFTREEVCKSINEIKHQPMTPDRIHVLAELVYIKNNFSGFPAEADAQRERSSGDLTREAARAWVMGMQNTDGTTGPHWTMEKTEEARAQRGINCESLAFWVAMNMVYSDYAKVAEKVSANSMDFYAYMAEAFLKDKDSKNQGGEKLARYYEYVVL